MPGLPAKLEDGRSSPWNHACVAGVLDRSNQPLGPGGRPAWHMVICFIFPTDGGIWIDSSLLLLLPGLVPASSLFPTSTTCSATICIQAIPHPRALFSPTSVLRFFPAFSNFSFVACFSHFCCSFFWPWRGLRALSPRFRLPPLPCHLSAPPLSVCVLSRLPPRPLLIPPFRAMRKVTWTVPAGPVTTRSLASSARSLLLSLFSTLWRSAPARFWSGSLLF